MDPVQVLLLGVLAPGALALVIVALLRRPRTAERPLPVPAAPALALAAGYGLTFALLLGWPALLPVDVTQVSPWVALVAAGIGFLGRRRGLATGVLGLGLGVFLARPLFAGEPGLLVLFAVAIAATLVALERGLDRVFATADPRGGALGATVLTAGAAAVILFSDTASLAQVTGALAAALGALFALGLLRPAAAEMRRASPVIAGILATNLWSAALYAEGRYEVIALVALAPLAAAFLKRPVRTLIAVAAPAALLALPSAAAATIAGLRYFAPPPASAPASAGPTADTADPDYGY